jgi:two-component system, OmpR family, clock-associated histidine kinase SasA
VRAKIEEKSQKLNTDLPMDLPCVHADSDHIRQVLINLLENAIKYTPEGGTIQVSILHRTTQKVQVTICDDGPGIPEEKQRFIFQDSFRLERDEDIEGYGIGLALCQRILRSHYGQIWVESTPNEGSSFHFTLPVYRH